MRNFDRNIPEEREEQSHPDPANQPVDMNRRGFLGAVLATAFLTACGDKDMSKPPVVGNAPDTAESIARKHELPEIRKMIVERYPNLGHYITVEEKQVLKVNFRELGMADTYNDDIIVQAYLLKVSYNGMLEDDVIRKADMIEDMNYLDPDVRMWPRKIAIVCRNHKTDMEVARANLRQYDRDHPNREEMSYQKFVDIATKVVKDVQTQMAVLKKNNLEENNKYNLINRFTELIDSDFLVGLSIHEVMPADYNEITRIAVLRALFEEGFEINKIPAIHDNVASFGPMQMSVMPYEGRNRDNPFGAETKTVGIGKKKKTVNLVGDIEPYLADFGLPHRLCDCIKLEDQLKAGMLLLLRNFRWLFEDQLSSDERFISMWDSASLVDRRTFLATILGAAHNNPKNAKRAIEQCLRWGNKNSADYFVDDHPKTKEEVTNLAQLRTSYINIAKRAHSISAREGEMTSNLIRRFSKTGDTTELKLTEVPVAPAAAVDTGGTKVVGGRKLKVERETKLLIRERNGIAYFTFTVPNWQLPHMLDDLCGKSNVGMVAAVKKFNDSDHFAPGDVILMPVDFMAKELKSPDLIQITIPKGIKKEEYLRGILKDGVHPDVVVMYTATEKVSGLEDLDDVIKIPKSLVRPDVLERK